MRYPLLLYEFDNSSYFIWNGLETSGNLQCILVVSKLKSTYFYCLTLGIKN